MVRFVVLCNALLVFVNSISYQCKTVETEGYGVGVERTLEAASRARIQTKLEGTGWTRDANAEYQGADSIGSDPSVAYGIYVFLLVIN